MSTLTIDVVTDATAAAADLDTVASAARGAGDAVQAAGGQVQTASVDFERMGDSTDNVASKSSQAAAGIGDLAGGLEAVGATGAATALEGVALASSVAAGAGDVLNLVAETTVGRYIAQTAASIGHKVATVAGAVATGAMTAAQWALNAAMSASPITLIVLGLAAIAAGLIYAYKHSETFRSIVDGAMSRARDVIDAVSRAVSTVIGWFRDLPGEARQAWEAVREAVAEKVAAAIERVGDIADRLRDSISNAVGFVQGRLEAMFDPIRDAIGWVQDLIDKIRSIDFPDLPGFLGRGSTTLGGSSTSTTTVTIPITIDASGGTDPDATARSLIEQLERYFGRVPDFTGLSSSVVTS